MSSEGLANFAITEPLDQTDGKPHSAWSDLANAFMDESKQQLKGLAQVVGAGDTIKLEPRQDEPDSITGRHADMIGRAAADAIPIIVTGLAVRAGLGRLLLKEAEPVISTAQSSLLLQRSALGLNSVETATTGFLTGALLHPSDDRNYSSLGSFLMDRTTSGAVGSLSFLTVNTLSYGTAKYLAASKNVIADTLKNPIGIGAISGFLGGAVNPQIDSVIRKHELNTDLSQIETSVYQGAFVGLAFGVLGAARGARPTEQVGTTPAETNSSEPTLLGAASQKFQDIVGSTADSPTTFQPTHYTIKSGQFNVGYKPTEKSSMPEDWMSGKQSEQETTTTTTPPNKVATTQPEGLAASGSAAATARADLSTSSSASAEYIISDLHLPHLNRSNPPKSAFSFLSLGSSEVGRTHIASDLIKSFKNSFGPPKVILHETAHDYHGAPIFHNKLSEFSEPKSFGHLDLYSYLMDEDSPYKKPKDYEPSLQTLKDSFGENSDEIKQLSTSGFFRQVPNIADFIKENPEQHKLLVAEKLNAGQPIDLEQLRGFSKLGGIFGRESLVYKYLSEKTEMHRVVPSLAKFVEQIPGSRAETIKTLIEKNAHRQELAPEMLEAEETLKNNLNSDAQIELQAIKHKWVKSLDQDNLSAETKGMESTSFDAAWELARKIFEKQSRLDSSPPTEDYPRVVKVLGDFIASDPVNNSRVVDRVLLEHTPTQSIDSSYLRSRNVIESTFGIGSDTTQKILALPTDDSRHAVTIAKLLRYDSHTAPIIESIINAQPAETKLAPERILALRTLEDSFGKDAPQNTELLAREKDGLNLWHVASFLDENQGLSNGIDVFGLRGNPETSGKFDTHTGKALDDPYKLDLIAWDKIWQLMKDDSPLVGPPEPKLQRLANGAFVTVSHETEQSPVKQGVKLDLDKALESGGTNALSKLIISSSNVFSSNQTGKGKLTELTKDTQSASDQLLLSDQTVGKIHVHPELLEKRMALVDRLLNENAKPSAFNTVRLQSLFELENHYAPQSKTMQSMLEIENKGHISLRDFAGLLTDSETNNRSLRKNEPVDPSLLAKVVEVSDRERSYYCSTLTNLQDYLSVASESKVPFEKLLQFSESNDLAGLTTFIKVTQTADGLSSIDPFRSRIGAINSSKKTDFSQFVKPADSTDSTNSSGFADSDHAMSSDHSINSIATAPARPSTIGGEPYQNPRQTLVEKLINEDAPSFKLEPKRLVAYESLVKTFGENSDTMHYLQKIESPTLLRDVSTFIDKHPTDGSALIQRLANDHAGVSKFETYRIEAILKIEKVFPLGNKYLSKMYEREQNGLRLLDIASYLDQSNSKNLIISSLGNKTEEAGSPVVRDSMSKQLLEHLLDSNAPNKKFTFAYLSAHLKLNEYLGADSSAMKKLLELSETSGLDITGLKEFIDENVNDHKLMVQHMVDSGATVKELSSDRLRGLSILMQKLNPDRENFEYLLSLEKQGLKIGELAKYVSDDPHARAPQVNALLTQRASVKELNLKRLGDAAMIKKVTSFFPNDENTVKAIAQLQNDGLSANRLMGFIEESPQSRTELVKKLISEGADTNRFNQHMSLSLFPDDVAYKILSSGQGELSQSAKLIGELKNFKTGEQFYKTIVAWVREGHPANSPVLLQLNDQIKQGNMQVDLSQNVDQSSNVRARTNKGAKLASVLKAAVDGIDKQIPKDKPIVLLGRDNWQLLPLLKAQGRQVQYFLWSRLQGTDSSTRAQWLKEVSPNAAVVDTGYSGSIINLIRGIDPSASGYLLSSGGRYPQLLSGAMAANVSQIEYFPKLVGRSKSYTDNGGAISKSSDRDYDEQKQQKDLTHRWHVQRANTDLLRAAGLSDWAVWRFSDFVGLTPKERLGVDTNAEVDQHYANIEQLRKTTKPDYTQIGDMSPFAFNWNVGSNNMSP